MLVSTSSIGWRDASLIRWGYCRGGCSIYALRLAFGESVGHPGVVMRARLLAIVVPCHFSAYRCVISKVLASIRVIRMLPPLGYCVRGRLLLVLVFV